MSNTRLPAFTATEWPGYTLFNSGVTYLPTSGFSRLTTATANSALGGRLCVFPAAYIGGDNEWFFSAANVISIIGGEAVMAYATSPKYIGQVRRQTDGSYYILAADKMALETTIRIAYNPFPFWVSNAPIGNVAANQGVLGPPGAGGTGTVVPPAGTGNGLGGNDPIRPHD